MTDQVWRHRGRLAVAGPPGWFPVERIDVMRPDAAARVGVELWPSADGDIDRAVGRHLARLAAVLPGWVEHECAQDNRSVDGASTRRRLCGWNEPGGSEVTAEFVFKKTQRGIAVVTTVVRPDADDYVRKEARGVADSAGLVGPVESSSGSASRPDRASDSDWAGVRARWLADALDYDDGVETGRTRLTLAEAAVAARRAGASSFPGVPRGFVDALGADAPVVLSTAERCLLARSHDDPDLARRVVVAASHDLLTLVDTVVDGQRRARWLVGRPEAAVCVEQLAGSDDLVLSDLDPGAIAAAVCDGTERSDQPQEPIPSSMPAVAEVVSGRVTESDLELGKALGGAPITLRRARTAYRRGESIVGGDVQWLCAADGTAWHLDGEGPLTAESEVTLRRMARDALLLLIAEVLPGGAENTPRDDTHRQEGGL